MKFLVNLFQKVLAYIKSIFAVFNLPAFIYDSLYTKPVTKHTYYKLFDTMQPRLEKYKRILDVGIGTGGALKAIVDRFPKDTFIVGIDIDKNYIKKATDLFKTDRNVRIREQNFYELADTKEKYDAIVFSSSFMLMPDRKKALDIAKSLLTPGGKIYFLMTLYNQRKKFIERIKPYLKYYTTIDFGKITYEWEFEELLKESKLPITKKEKLSYKDSPLFAFFRVFLVECQAQV
jgi:ubiquinone/menaquinone biosynthesis C-methylase UbiE